MGHTSPITRGTRGGWSPNIRGVMLNLAWPMAKLLAFVASLGVPHDRATARALTDHLFGIGAMVSVGNNMCKGVGVVGGVSVGGDYDNSLDNGGLGDGGIGGGGGVGGKCHLSCK